MNELKIKKAFTLVELIIVITILVILATIAFVSFQNYTKDSRDANRLTTINNISKGLDIFQIKTGFYPEPESKTSFTGAGDKKLHQGIISDNITNTINLSEIPLDPKEKTNYIYSTYGDGKYYQIASEAENITSFLYNTTYAENKSSIVKGNYKFDPSLPSLIVIPNSLTGSSIFDPKVCFVTNGGLNSITSSGNCLKKEDMRLNSFDNSLVGYWDMETTFNSGGTDYLKDLSGNNNHGVGSGGISIGGTGGRLGSSTFFNGKTTFNQTGVNQFIKIEDSESLKNFGNQITISTVSYSSENNDGGRFLFHRYTDHISGGQDKNYVYGNYATTAGLFGFINLNVSTSTGGIIGVRPLKNLNSIFNYGGKYYLTTSVYNGKSLKLFLNGIFMNEKYIDDKNTQANNRNIYNSTGANFIGSWCRNLTCQYPNYPAQTFHGLIDEVKIYNRALSDEEIAQQARIAGF